MKIKIKTSCVVVFVFLIKVSIAQISVGFDVGYGFNTIDDKDSYALNIPWPSAIQTDGNQLGLFKNGEGFSKKIFITWEASRHFSVSLIYRNFNIAMTDSKRKVATNNLGVGIKVNFRSNERKVIPFIQAEYMFVNSSRLRQEQATDGLGQTQPAFDETFKTTFGLGVDLGTEIRLADVLNMQLLAGPHAILVIKQKEIGDFLNGIAYTGTSIAQPSEMQDGTLFLQFSVGMKYYFSKRKKKRDF